MYGRGRGGRNENAPDENGWIGETQILVRMEGIDGNCDLAGYEDCFSVMSFSWNVARQVGPTQLPARIRRAEADFRRAAEKKRAIEEGHQTEEEKAKDALASSSSLQADPLAPLVQPSLVFASSEVEPRGSVSEKPHVGHFTLTKFNDINSPQLYQMILSQKRGVEAQVILVQERVKNFVAKTPEEKSAEEKAEAEKNSKRGGGFHLSGGFHPSDPSDDAAASSSAAPVERESVVHQQWILIDAFLENVSISGGTGGQPVETISIDFESFQYYFAENKPKTNKTAAAATPAKKAVKSHSIIYDGLRQECKPYTAAVLAEINKSDELRPTSSVVLGYL